MINIKYPINDYTFLDYPDNINQALIIYFIGCEHDCINCHNKQFQKFNKNKDILIFNNNEFNIFERLIESRIKDIKSNKLVLSGGDPLFKNNLEFVKNFLINYNNKYDICIYTGYDIEYVKNNNIKGFKFIKCNKYIELLNQKTEKTNNFIKLASSNQNFYNNNYIKLSENGIYFFEKLN